MILSLWLVVKKGLIMSKDLDFVRILTILFFFIVLEIFCDSGWAENIQNCKKTQADTLLQVATQKYGKVEFGVGLKIFEDVLTIYRELKDIKSEGITLNYIGSLYKDVRDYPNAIIYYQKALEISRNLGDKDNEVIILKNISESSYSFPVSRPIPARIRAGSRR